MVVGAPLEDARHLARRYDRVRQEAEAQVTFTKGNVFIGSAFSVVTNCIFHAYQSCQYAIFCY